MDTPFVTRAAEARSFTTTPTDVMSFLCEGNESMPDVMVERLARGDGPPLHSHPWQAWDVITRGTVRYRVGDETYDLEQGDFIYVPRDAVHAFMATSDEAEIVQFQSPGGFHVAYAEIAAVFANGKPDFAELGEVARRHRITLHGPPLRAST